MNLDQPPTSQLDESLARTFGREWWAHADAAGNFLQIVFWLIAVVFVAVEIDQFWAAALGVALVGLSAFRAMWRVAQQRTDWLRRIYARPTLSVAPGPELEVYDANSNSSSRRIRALVSNESDTACDLVATVVELDGLPDTGRPEVPWPVQWRHGTGRVHRLFPGDSEMLDVAGVRQVLKHGFEPQLEVFLPAPHSASRADLGKDPVALRVRVWDANGGQLSADFTIKILSPRSSEIAFVLEEHALPAA